ncbi:unnamed protein product [Lupinus luteus]|uniref:Uncharacterized protein n=1 Tax=Lupinus luteus TaxID=3873 RepID=A0AAV1WNU5_LUPLU
MPFLIEREVLCGWKGYSPNTDGGERWRCRSSDWGKVKMSVGLGQGGGDGWGGSTTTLQGWGEGENGIQNGI